MQTTKQENGSYKLGVEQRLSKLETLVTEIKDNHLKHIEDKIDGLGDKMNSYVNREEWAAHLKKDDDHELRIRAIEKLIWKYVGAVSVLAFLASLLGNTIAEQIFK